MRQMLSTRDDDERRMIRAVLCGLVILVSVLRGISFKTKWRNQSFDIILEERNYNTLNCYKCCSVFRCCMRSWIGAQCHNLSLFNEHVAVNVESLCSSGSVITLPCWQTLARQHLFPWSVFTWKLLVGILTVLGIELDMSTGVANGANSKQTVNLLEAFEFHEFPCMLARFIGWERVCKLLL